MEGWLGKKSHNLSCNILDQPDNANGNYGSKKSSTEAEMVMAGRALIVLFPAHGLLLSGIAGRLLWTAAFLNALLAMILNTVIYILLHHE